MVLLAVIVFFITRNGGSLPLIGDSSAPAPSFTFTMKGVSYVPVESQGSASDQKKGADKAADGVKHTLDLLYSTAFVDQDTWGDPGEIDQLFTDDAADQIEPNLDALTLGKDAGATYDYVDPGRGTLTVRVLTDAHGSELRAFARTTFKALATHTDGSFTTITATGSFFLVKDGDTWKIESFDVNRAEKSAKAPATSASPSESAQ